MNYYSRIFARKTTGLASTLALVSALSLLTACSEDFDNPVDEQNFNAGELDLTTYVALGDSLTAGYADGALYYDGQINSFPNILAGAFAQVGGGSFTQPLVNDNSGALTVGGGFVRDNPLDPTSDIPRRLVLGLNADAELRPKRVTIPEIESEIPSTEVTQVIAGPFNNLGVPGARSFHLTLDSYGNAANLLARAANPYYVRFATSPDANLTKDAIAQAPTFFTLWIGNNDVLGYATGGGVGFDSREKVIGKDADGNDIKQQYGTTSDDISNPETVFTPSFAGVVGGLLAQGAKGLVANIPAITSLPYFTTVPYNPIPLDQATADFVNGEYAAYNQGLDAAVGLMLIDEVEANLRKINFTAGQNPPVILDEDLVDISAINPGLVKMRQATAEDFILLPTSSLLGTPRLIDDIPENDQKTAIGVAAPLLDADVLTKAEAAEVEKARTAYNAVIKQTADANENLVLFDAAALLADVADEDGFSFGTGTISTTFATGGAFSLDGVHPTAKGYAVIATEMIKTLNSYFGANIPRVDPSQYPEVYYDGISTSSP